MEGCTVLVYSGECAGYDTSLACACPRMTVGLGAWDATYSCGWRRCATPTFAGENPFRAPAFNRGHLASLRTRLDADGICLQSNDYNCGPAAAVTALRKLGFPAEEGAIAILAHTSSATSTPPDVLARALHNRHSKEGLDRSYRIFRRVEELKHDGLTLVATKYRFWVDHYVTVLKVTDDEIVVGDPARGRCTFTHQDLRDKWRFEGVVLRRESRISAGSMSSNRARTGN